MDPRNIKNANVIIEDVDSDDDDTPSHARHPPAEATTLSAEQQIIQERHESIVLLKNLGDKDMKASEYKKAIRNYEVALEEDPCCPQHLIWRILMNKGRAHAALGEHTAAITCFECSLYFSRNNPTAHRNIGTSLIALQRYSDALRHFQGLMDRFPSCEREWTQSIARCMDAINKKKADALVPDAASLSMCYKPAKASAAPAPRVTHSNREREAYASFAPPTGASTNATIIDAEASKQWRRGVDITDPTNKVTDAVTDAATRIRQWLKAEGAKSFAEIGEYVSRNGIDIGHHKVAKFCKMFPYFNVAAGVTRKGSSTLYVHAV